MNIGEKIKQLRTEKNLTQPQLAEAIGIEQSYLSKLENDKSVPSADIFQAILKALNIEVGSFLEGIDDKIIHRQLRQIPEVANYLNAGIAYKVHNIKKWLFCSAAACVIGLTLIVAGYKALIFKNVKYQYESYLVLTVGETEELFLNFNLYPSTQPCIGTAVDIAHCLKKNEEREAQRKAAQARVKVDTLFMNDHQGEYIYRDVKGGHREYKYKGQNISTATQNAYLLLLGSFISIGGLFGFIVEFRLRSLKI